MRHIGAIGFMMWLISCGAAQPPHAGPVLAQIQLRDQRLVIYGGGGAGQPSFAVHSSAGQVLADGLSLDDLRGRHPDLYRMYQTGMAGVHAATDVAHVPAGPRRLDASYTPSNVPNAAVW